MENSRNINMLGSFSSVDSAWRTAISALRLEGQWVESVSDETSVGSGFGQCERPYREIVGCSFTIQNSRDRIVNSSVRRLNLPFLFANLLWTLSGSDKVDDIGAYNSRGNCFSDDGVTLASAFGPKLFGTPHAQFDHVAALLSRDPATRRAVINLFDGDAIANRSKDVSCALAVHFLVRQGGLDCIVYMRSQSAVMVLPYDLFLFTMLHEAMAVRTGIQLGRYSHVCSSFHYYDDEESLVEKILLESSQINNSAMPQMRSFTEEERQKIVAFESLLRPFVEGEAPGELNIRSLSQFDSLDPYWQEMFLKFFGEKEGKSSPTTTSSHVSVLGGAVRKIKGRR